MPASGKRGSTRQRRTERAILFEVSGFAAVNDGSMNLVLRRLVRAPNRLEALRVASIDTCSIVLELSDYHAGVNREPAEYAMTVVARALLPGEAWIS